MVEIICGRAKSGKSTLLIDRICENARVGIKGQILIVPEQYSHETERRLLSKGGNKISLSAEVLTFQRLISRVFSIEGGLARQYLDDGGKILAMYHALALARENLRVFKTPSRKIEFLTSLVSAAEELNSHMITPSLLNTAADKLSDSLGDKLSDLAMILEMYAFVTENAGAESSDKLVSLAEKLRVSSYLTDKHIFMDGFSDFTGLELEIVKIMLGKSAGFVMALTYSEDENLMAAGIFEPQRRTISQLKHVCPELNETYLEPQTKKPELLHLERGIFDYTNPVFTGDCDAVKMFSAGDPFSECAVAASNILKLVRKHDVKFGECAVVARDYERYDDILKTVFAQYEIPVFSDDLSDITEKPALMLITSALDIAADNFTYDAVFRYLKTGLTGIPNDDCALLENYVLKWNLRGHAWTRERPWTENPRGYTKEFTDSDKELLRRINSIRLSVRKPLLQLKERLSHGKTVSGKAEALYEFCEIIKLPELISIRAKMLTDRGELKLAEEYSQLWEIFVGALEQCVSTLGELEITTSEFAALFRLILGAYKVATIPVSLDRVSTGDALRTGQKQVKYLFILGANDGNFPPPVAAESVLSDAERLELRKFGLDIPPESSDKLGRELAIIYRVFSVATDGIFISYAVSDAAGNEQRPSFMMTRLNILFPKLSITPERAMNQMYKLAAYAPCLELAVSGKSAVNLNAVSIARECISQNREISEALKKIEETGNLRNMPLSETTVEKLYGKNIRLSASRIDTIKSCRFSYFMRYGLRAKPRIPAGFEAPEIGTFVHFVLEYVTRNVKSLGGFAEIEPETLRQLVDECVNLYVHEVLEDFTDKSARFVYLFNRLRRTVQKLVENLAAELAESDFEPVEFELGFSEEGKFPPIVREFDDISVTVGGFVDRVDAWEKNGKLYLRVLDYKTGSKKFSLSDIWHGLAMQMLIYLSALRENGEQVYGKEIVPAGVLYMPARESILAASRKATDEEIRKLLRRKLLRSGIVLDDPEVIAAMEHGIESESKYLPLRKNKDGGFSANSSLATLARFGGLFRHVDKVLGDISREIKSGDLTPNPYYRNLSETACDYCDFHSACRFDTKNGNDRLRYLYPLRDNEFWQLLEQNEKGTI